ncbi:MAG: ribonuclease III [Rhizobiaceae bacterium]
MAAARVSAQKIATLEERIGYTFKEHARLVRALTHASATKVSGDIPHYERLEFLGDRVLGLCVAELLFAQFPDAREGELSVRLNAMVSGKTCAEIADDIGLHDFIQAGADVKQLTSKRMRSVRADVTESLIAAIYLDGGIEAASQFVQKFWQKRLQQDNGAIRDSKTALQEWAHTQSGATPVYKIVKRSGPDHDPTFVVEVEIEGSQNAQGRGKSKRAAEQAAAQAVLLRESVWLQTAKGTIKENTK